VQKYVIFFIFYNFNGFNCKLIIFPVIRVHLALLILEAYLPLRLGRTLPQWRLCENSNGELFFPYTLNGTRITRITRIYADFKIREHPCYLRYPRSIIYLTEGDYLV
jgi:hypothetical protein